MKISKWGFVTVILGAVLFNNTSSYAASENDAKVMKCYNKISNMEKSLDKRESSGNSEKREWGKKARIILVEAKKAAKNDDGESCLDLWNKAKVMKRFGYE